LADQKDNKERFWNPNDKRIFTPHIFLVEAGRLIFIKFSKIFVCEAINQYKFNFLDLRIKFGKMIAKVYCYFILGVSPCIKKIILLLYFPYKHNNNKRFF